MKIKEKRGEDEFHAEGWFAGRAVREWRKTLNSDGEKTKQRIGFHADTKS